MPNLVCHSLQRFPFIIARLVFQGIEAPKPETLVALAHPLDAVDTDLLVDAAVQQESLGQRKAREQLRRSVLSRLDREIRDRAERLSLSDDEKDAFRAAVLEFIRKQLEGKGLLEMAGISPEDKPYEALRKANDKAVLDALRITLILQAVEMAARQLKGGRSLLERIDIDHH